ncbi:iron-containing alcohol dehydrogenase [Nonomuraea roseoviolacea]|uniref:Alcohol dehydrogenase class IV n=1 Tax=Nonomuraea roseoviolacea subsp. carminata TaxID=160689 RepID=A0ABT1K4T5_9ACTN|nr:iron-containing alcohol dehydrogenase [Nonomuraea roseoviolacea]MCP2349016.1 alcohol dehydrogenase class IV [Nonomuraea roseoviolacea subsp. carminata]
MTFTITPTGLVHFGEGALRELPGAVAATGRTRAFVVTDPGIGAAGILDRVLALLPGAGVFAEVEPNPSTTTIAAAAGAATAFGDAAIVALGGGSSLDAAKAVALAAANPGVEVAALDYRAPGLNAGLPIVAVPTTAGTGAETNGFGVIEDPAAACKIYLGNGTTQPVTSILDPELTTGLPPRATAATGVDALVHGIESLTARGRNPVSEAYAHHAVRLVHRRLPDAVKDGADLEARGNLLLGSHLAGRALSISGLGLVHGIAHAVTARTGAPHGLALASVLGAVLEFNLPACAEQYADIALDLGLGRADGRAMVEEVREFVARVGARTTLAELGCTPDMAAGLAAVALADPVTANTPRLPGEDELRDLIVGAMEGS